jgi:hypothetical protein
VNGYGTTGATEAHTAPLVVASVLWVGVREALVKRPLWAAVSIPVKLKERGAALTASPAGPAGVG